jgi:phosphoglycerate kinase
MLKLHKKGAIFPLPTDVIVAQELNKNAVICTKSINSLAPDDMILDISESFAKNVATLVGSSSTIIWNGPVGAFEFEPFSRGTEIVAKAIANSNAFSLAGGGDTIAAINKYGLFDKISYVSTAGGALLEFLGGEELPSLKALQLRLS